MINSHPYIFADPNPADEFPGGKVSLPRFRSSLKFWTLMASIAAFSWAGWVVIAGFLPLYMIPLAPLFVSALIGSKSRMSRIERRFGMIYLLFTAFTFIGVIGAVDTSRALIGSLGWLSNYFLIYVTAAIIGSVSEWRAMILCYTLTQLVSLGFAIPQYFFGTFFISPAAYESQVSGLEGMAYAFGKNYLPLVSFGLCTLLEKALFKDKGATVIFKKTALLAMLVAVIAIALSESRSSQVAIGFGCLFIGWRAGIFSVATLRALSLCVLIASAGLYFGGEKWAKVLSDEGLAGDGSFLYRTNSWAAGWDMAMEHWVAGVGMGNYKYHVADYLFQRLDLLGDMGLLNSEGEISVEVHNVIIGIGAMAGMPAMILFCWYYFSVTRFGWILSKRVSESRELRLIAFSTCIYLIMYLVSMSMHNLFNDNVPWVIIGAFLGTYRRATSCQNKV